MYYATTIVACICDILHANALISLQSTSWYTVWGSWWVPRVQSHHVYWNAIY